METGIALKPEPSLYVYAVVSTVPEDLNEIGGIEAGSNLFAVQSKGLNCIVSTVPLSEYSHGVHESAARQLEWITPRALRHDEIIRHLHGTTTTVPFKFGTLCATPTQLLEILDKFRRSFADLLDRFKDQEEWIVKAYVAEELINQRVGKDPELLALTASQPSPPQGRAYLLQKKRERLAAGLADEFISSLGYGIHAGLEQVTKYIVTSGVCSDREANSLRTVFNAALLVHKDGFASLEKTLAEIESEYAEYQLLIELSGPWPPYTFTTDIEGLISV